MECHGFLFPTRIVSYVETPVETIAANSVIDDKAPTPASRFSPKHFQCALLRRAALRTKLRMCLKFLPRFRC